MKHPIQRGLWLIMLVSLWSACTTSDLTPLLADDDFGPRPQRYQEIATAWLNTHYRFTPPNPIRPDELSISEPTKVAAVDVMLGRVVGWQIVLGPENKMVTNFTELKYTRLIINRGRIVLVTSSNRPFLSVPK